MQLTSVPDPQLKVHIRILIFSLVDFKMLFCFIYEKVLSTEIDVGLWVEAV